MQWVPTRNKDDQTNRSFGFSGSHRGEGSLGQTQRSKAYRNGDLEVINCVSRGSAWEE